MDRECTFAVTSIMLYKFSWLNFSVDVSSIGYVCLCFCGVAFVGSLSVVHKSAHRLIDFPYFLDFILVFHFLLTFDNNGSVVGRPMPYLRNSL